MYGMLLMYVIIALFFGGLTAISLFLGGHDGMDTGDVSHDLSSGHGDSGESGWAGWFSLKVISVFGTAFGASGAIAIQRETGVEVEMYLAQVEGDNISFFRLDS